jgi:hypothetical protein
MEWWLTTSSTPDLTVSDWLRDGRPGMAQEFSLGRHLLNDCEEQSDFISIGYRGLHVRVKHKAYEADHYFHIESRLIMRGALPPRFRIM